MAMLNIADALELEELDENIYRSKRLWKPRGNRGVFGGQIIALGLSAATKTVESKYFVHSLQSYFLLPGDNERPIIFRVTRVRDGRSYATRLVHAIQKGKIIFSCSCSFQVPEISILDHQYKMPEVPMPENVMNTEEKMREWAELKQLPEKFRANIRLRLEDPIPIEVKKVEYPETFQDYLTPKKSDPTQMVVAAYCSDHLLLETSLIAHGITTHTNPRLRMVVTLDHVIWFHAPFRADEWMLFVME
ncbi:Acyl-CoA thioesterase 8, partial [Nowakowskiella sp. JEL0078]